MERGRPGGHEQGLKSGAHVSVRRNKPKQPSGGSRHLAVRDGQCHPHSQPIPYPPPAATRDAIATGCIEVAGFISPSHRSCIAKMHNVIW